MADLKLDLRAAIALRQHWQQQLETAQGAADKEGERIAAQFVAEYDALIAALELSTGKPSGNTA